MPSFKKRSIPSSQRMDPTEELARFKQVLLQMPVQYDFKYTSSARREFLATLNSVLHLDPSDLEINVNNHNHYGRPCGALFQRGEACYRCLTCGYDETCAMCGHCFQKDKHQGHEIHKSIIQKDNAGICDCGDEFAYPDSQCVHFLTLGGNKVYQPLSEAQLDHLLNALSVLLDYVIDVMHNSFACVMPYQTPEEILASVDYSALDHEKYFGYDTPSGKYGLVLYSDQVHQYKDAVQRIKYVTRKVDDFAEMIASRCNSHGRAVVMISENINMLLKKQEMLTSTGLSACIRSTRDIFREEMCADIINWYSDFTSTNIAKSLPQVKSVAVKAMFMPYNRGCNLPSNPIMFKDSLIINPTTLRKDMNSIIARTNGKWDIPDELKNSVMYPDRDDISVDDSFIGSRFQFLLLFDVRFCKAPREKLHCIYIPVMDQAFEFLGLMVAQIMDIYEDILTLFLMVDREPEYSIMPILSPQVFTSPTNAALILKHGDVLKMIKVMYNYVTTFKTSNSFLSYPKTGVVFQTLKNRKWAHVLLDLSYVITRNPDIDNIFKLFFCFPEYIQFLAVFQSKPVFKREAREHVEYENQDYTVFFNALTVISLFSESISKVLNKIPKDHLLSQGNPMDVLYHSYTTKMKKSFSETLYTIIVRKIIELLFMDPPLPDEINGLRIISDKEDVIEFERSKYIDANVIAHNILEEKVGFLHPLHSMLSWLVEMDNSMDNDRTFYHLMNMIQGEYDFFLKERGGISGPGKLSNSDSDGILAFFDIPIKKLVLVSQIKVGLWVRNGSSIRTQMNLYRYSGGREFGFTRDLFLVQMFITFFPDMDHAIWNILHRWLLDDWANGITKSEVYNPTQLQSMVEEFMLFLIHLLTADLHLHKLDAATVKDELIKREIVHSLGFSKLTFSEIDAAIPEHISSAKRYPGIFDQCVEEVISTKDKNESPKLYKLKKELECEINPFYVHYTRNKSEECSSAIKDKIHKITGMNKSEIVINPIEIDWSDSVFEKLNDVLANNVISQFVLNTLNYGIERLESDEKITEVQNESDRINGELESHGSDTLIDLTLHFIHMMSKHKNWNSTALEDSNIPKILERLIHLVNLDGAFNFRSKIVAIIKSLRELLESNNFDIISIIPNFNEEIFDVPLDRAPRSNNKWENDPAYKKKKKLALKKKAKLMAKLKKQQDKFAEKFIPPDIACQDSTDVNLSDFNESSQVLDGEMHNHDTAAAPQSWEFPEQTCILCHMPPANENEVFGVFGYVTESNQFRYVPYNNNYWFMKAFGGKSNLDEKHEYVNKDLAGFVKNCEDESIMGPGFPTEGDPLSGLSMVDNQAVFTSCGHGMHYQCYAHYYESSKNKQLSQITRTVPENIERKEFFCPLCKTINNIFIPVYYSSVSDNFNDEFKHKLPLMELIKPNFDKHRMGEPAILDMLTVELMNRTKDKMKSKDWFMQSDIVDGTLTYTLNKNSSTPEILMNCMSNLVSLSPPFDTVSSLISKTIESIEISLRGHGYNEGDENRLLIHQINNQTLISLRVWLQLRDMMRCVHGRVQDNRLRMLSETSIGVLDNLINDDDLIFNGQDYFLLLTMCDESNCLNFSFQKLIGIAFVKHVKQALMNLTLMFLKKLEFESETVNLDWLTNEAFAGDANNFLQILEAFSGKTVPSGNVDGIYSMLIKLVTPFLRKCLILAYAKFPVIINEEVIIDNSLNECDRICQVLNLPDVVEILDNFKVEEYFNVNEIDKLRMAKSRIPYPGLVRLINLPLKLSEFFTECHNLKNEDEKPIEPAICLICAAMVDVQTFNYNDKFGSCNMHIRWECIDAGRGILFLPVSNCILILDNGKGSFIQSPYMDDYGESDEDGKKGHELHLIKEKYEDLQMRIWMKHNIQNVIAKKFESLSDVGGWETL